MNRRGFANIILVIVVIAIVAAAGYFLFIRKSVPPITTNPLNPITTSTVAQKNSSAPTEKPGWKAIVWHDPQNKIFGFKFDVPNSWTEQQQHPGMVISYSSCNHSGCSDIMSFNVEATVGVAPKYYPPLPQYIESTGTVDVGGITAEKMTASYPAKYTITQITFIKDSASYLIELYTTPTDLQGAGSIFDDILKSFAFITPQPPQTPPAEYGLLEGLANWEIDYQFQAQTQNINFPSCSDGRTGNTGNKYTFAMLTEGDINTPYNNAITILKNNGWKQCNEVTVEGGVAITDIFIKDSRLIGFYRSYSAGVGNHLTISIQY